MCLRGALTLTLALILSLPLVTLDLTLAPT